MNLLQISKLHTLNHKEKMRILRAQKKVLESTTADRLIVNGKLEAELQEAEAIEKALVELFHSYSPKKDPKKQ